MVGVVMVEGGMCTNNVLRGIERMGGVGVVCHGGLSAIVVINRCWAARRIEIISSARHQTRRNAVAGIIRDVNVVHVAVRPKNQGRRSVVASLLLACSRTEPVSVCRLRRRRAGAAVEWWMHILSSDRRIVWGA